jgi:hypothetical protein
VQERRSYGRSAVVYGLSSSLRRPHRSHWSRDSSVGIATGYGLDGPGFDFSLLHSVQTGSGAHPASYPIGTGGSFAGA